MESTAQSTLLTRLPVCLAVTARRFATHRSASTAIAYALMTFIAVAIVAVIAHLGGTVAGMYEQVKGLFAD